jgi:hypothetical protein
MSHQQFASVAVAYIQRTCLGIVTIAPSVNPSVPAYVGSKSYPLRVQVERQLAQTGTKQLSPQNSDQVLLLLGNVLADVNSEFPPAVSTPTTCSTAVEIVALVHQPAPGGQRRVCDQYGSSVAPATADADTEPPPVAPPAQVVEHTPVHDCWSVLDCF